MLDNAVHLGIADECAAGTREVALPVVASTLTTVAVFFPVIYVPGIAGTNHVVPWLAGATDAEARKKLEAPAERKPAESASAKEATPEPATEDIAADTLTRDEKIFVRNGSRGKPVTAKVSEMADFDMEDARNAALARSS